MNDTAIAARVAEINRTIRALEDRKERLLSQADGLERGG